jgi:starch synthase
MAMPNRIKVLFTAAELNPIAKVGGLADVMGALPKALVKLGVDVRIVIPKYGIVDEKKYPLKKVIDNIPVPFKKTQEKITVFTAPLPGSSIPVYLIDNLNYLGQGGVYFGADGSSTGLSKEAERFSFFSRSCLAIFEPLHWYPDIIHCHDWHVSLLPLLLKILASRDKKLRHIKTVLSIHNLEYQGRYNARQIMDLVGLKATDYPTLSVLRDGDLISLQQAILICDYLCTVSPAYAKEIITPQYGAGLSGDLAQRQNTLIGILNGIDVDRFNPATDRDVAATYTARDFSNKEKCKAALQKTCGLAVNNNIPTIGVVSRLAEQKGLDLVAAVADALVGAGAQLIVLGTGLPALETLMKNIAAKHPENIYSKIAFDPHFAQQVYAGSDLFLMPSKFEPCGLGQMIAMRYGTVPIVRATGGLKDTVADYNEQTGVGDGFVFEQYAAGGLLNAITRALRLYQDKKKWHTIIRRIMKKDFSWDQSASQYIAVYRRILHQ